MAEYFISRTEAEQSLLACASYLAERIKSVDGRADAIAAVIPQYLERGDVDLAAELSNTVDDPFTRDRLLTLVAEKCAQMDDDEYAMQLADTVEEPGLRAQAMERVGLQKAAKGQFEKALEIAGTMEHPDGVLVGVAVKQAADGLESSALEIIADGIQHPAAAVTALVEMASHELRTDNADRAVTFLERALDEAADIEHYEELARAYIDIGVAFIEAGRNDRAIETFDKARATAETIDNVHRDAFLSLTAQGFLQAGSLELADRTLDLVSDKTQIASCLLGYSREFWRKDERDEAVESLEEARAILESQHERETRDSKRRFRLFAEIAAQFAGFEKGERAIEIAESIKDDEQRIAALSQVASILTTRKEDEQARHALRAIPDDGDRVFALLGMSDAKVRNEDREAALDLLNEAWHLAETVPQFSYRAMAYIEIGKRFHALDESGRAGEVFSKAIETISGIRDESAKVKAVADLAALTSAAGLDTGSYAVEALKSGSR